MYRLVSNWYCLFLSEEPLIQVSKNLCQMMAFLIQPNAYPVKINKEALPVVYRNQKNAWINTHIFRDWFLNCFIPETKLKLRELGREEKAILFLDNCAAHPSEKELVSDDGFSYPAKCLSGQDFGKRLPNMTG